MVYLLSVQCQEYEEVTWPLFIQNYSLCWIQTSKAILAAWTATWIGSGGFYQKNKECSQGFTNCLKRHCLIPTYSAGLIKILQEPVTSTIRAGSSSTQLHPVISRGLSAWQHNLTQPNGYQRDSSSLSSLRLVVCCHCAGSNKLHRE